MNILLNYKMQELQQHFNDFCCCCCKTAFLGILFPFLSPQQFPRWLSDKESAYQAADVGLIPGSGRSPGGGKGYSLQFSGMENSMDCTVHGVGKSWTQLSTSHFLSRRFLEAGIFSLKTETVLGKLTLRGSQNLRLSVLSLG